MNPSNHCEQLDLFLLDLLTDEQAAQFEEHFEQCETCRKQAEQQSRLDELLHQVPGILPIPASLNARLQNLQLAARPDSQPSGRERMLGWMAAGLLAAAVVFVASYLRGVFDRDVPRELAVDPDSVPKLVDQNQVKPEKAPSQPPKSPEGPGEDAGKYVQVSFPESRQIGRGIKSKDPSVSIYFVYPTNRRQTQPATIPTEGETK